VTRNFLIETYSFLEKNPTTTLLIKSLSKLSKESSIKQKRNEGYNIVYLDETWVDTHHTASNQWKPPNPSDARKIPFNKGQRFVNLHAGCKTVFLPGCELVFKTLSTDGRDYHSEMNSVIFNK
jgi:hypothetical protein